MNMFSNIEDISQLEVLGSKEMIRNEINELIFPLNTNAKYTVNHEYHDTASFL